RTALAPRRAGPVRRTGPGGRGTGQGPLLRRVVGRRGGRRARPVAHKRLPALDLRLRLAVQSVAGRFRGPRIVTIPHLFGTNPFPASHCLAVTCQDACPSLTASTIAAAAAVCRRSGTPNVCAPGTGPASMVPQTGSSEEVVLMRLPSWPNRFGA